MRNRRPSLTTLSGLLCTLTFPATVMAQPQAEDAIGIVITVTGQVEAQDASGAVRTLRRGANVFSAETIAVGPDAYAQIRMIDKAIISLKSDTEFTIGSYEFDGNPATPDTATMSMIRGGFRTISGTIGDADEDTYRIDTQYASIGIRGTMHSAVIVDGVLFTGVYDGGTTISNNQGSIDAGIGADFDYTETLAGAAPRGLIEAPSVLGLVNFAPVLTEEAADTAATDGADSNTQNDVTEPAPRFNALANDDAAPNGTGAGNTLAAVSANSAPADRLAETTANITGGDPQDDVNPLQYSRGAAELDDGANGGNNGNSGNGNSGGNNGNSGNGNSGGNNGNSGNGNSGGNNGNSGNGNSGGNNGNSGNGNSGGNNGNSGTGNSGGNSGGNNGNNGNGNSGGDNGNNGGGNSGGNNGNSGNGNSGGDNGNSGNGNSGGNNGNSGNGNSGGDNGNSGNGNSGGNNGSSGNGNSGGNNGSSGNGNSGSNNGNSGNGNSGGNNGGRGNGNSGNNGNSGSGNGSNTLAIASRAPGIERIQQLPLRENEFVLSWGVWDSALPVAQNDIRRTISLFFDMDAERATLVPANMADLSGTVNYASSGKFAGTDATGAALRDVQMTFDVNLAGGPGAITNGRLVVLDSHRQTWNAAFDGSLTNASATMTNVAGTHADKPLSGSIQGVFTGTGSRPDFVSGFVLQSDGAFVHGITELTSD